MAMTAAEAELFYSQQAALFGDGARGSIAKGNNAQAQISFWTACQARLIQGLLRWRHKFGDPTQPFDQAFNIAREAANVGSPQVASDFDYGAVDVVAFLLGRPALELRSLYSPWPPPAGHSVRIPQLDVGLAAFLRSGEKPSEWDAVLARVPKRLKLVAQTFENYASLLSPSRGSVEPLVTESCALYERRGDSWGSLNGGGLSNQHATDFRLAAVLRAIGASAPAIAGAGHHWWPERSLTVGLGGPTKQ